MFNNFSAEAGIVVTTRDTARYLAWSPEDSFPEVFATSRMIALMELARLLSGAERRRAANAPSSAHKVS